ncbi:MAG: HAMP domain-containing sensor histidine kinase [Bacilli bacterium]
MKSRLLKQLFIIAVSACLILYISLGILLPNILLPIYEKNIYQYLKQPLELIENDVNTATFDEEVAYLYITSANEIIYSNNISEVISLSPEQILNQINQEYGKFKYLDKTYYYNTSRSKYVLKIALTNNNYINEIKLDIFSTLFPILFLTLLLISLLMLLWSRNLIKKIEHLKNKIDNLGNDNYKDNYNYKTFDEFKVLSDAIDNMKIALKEQDEYKNQMYQSISHDFKTPLTVIKSYLEAIDDGVLESKDARIIIKEQVNKLEQKVHSLLYLNKLNYIKDTNTYKNEQVDIKEIIDSAIKKFKIQKPKIKFEINVVGNTTFNGTYDMWEAIIDNILNNFMRYAEEEIKITLRNKSIKFYNDGENIDENILNNIFTPYKKGIKGEFGLGLSIVKKTVALFGYEISVKNEKKGVSFIIK